MALLTKDLSRPNGLAFSPDEKSLYVANSDPAKAIWMIYPIEADGTIGSGKVFKDVTSMVGKEHPGVPDGLRVDERGNVFATGPGGVHIYAPDGTLLGRVDTGLGDRQLRLRRRWQRPLHHRRDVHCAHQDQDERRRALRSEMWMSTSCGRPDAW